MDDLEMIADSLDAQDRIISRISHKHPYWKEDNIRRLYYNHWKGLGASAIGYLERTQPVHPRSTFAHYLLGKAIYTGYKTLKSLKQLENALKEIKKNRIV